MKSSKGTYNKLKRTVYIKLTVLIFVSIAAVIWMRSIARGRAGNRIVEFMQNNLGYDYDSALILYQDVIRNNLEYLLIFAVAILFIILARFLISQYSKYLNEVEEGLDMIIKDKSKEIKMSSEMLEMENKLNYLRTALVQSEQKKNDMVMYLAHDIKTPLTSIIGYLNLLEDAPDMPIELKAEYVNITLDKAYRLEKLINEFFEITRYSAQSNKISNESIDLHYMFIQMNDEFYPQLKSKGKEIQINIEGELIVKGDSDKLARVFNNILKNAIAYSNPNSVIIIDGYVDDNKIVTTFKSEGRIPEDKLATIFEKFYRLDSSRSADTGGSGLGLAIAKEIVTLHGGRIFAENNNNHTIFKVELPVK